MGRRGIGRDGVHFEHQRSGDFGSPTPYETRGDKLRFQSEPLADDRHDRVQRGHPMHHEECDENATAMRPLPLEEFAQAQVRHHELSVDEKEIEGRAKLVEQAVVRAARKSKREHTHGAPSSDRCYRGCFRIQLATWMEPNDGQTQPDHAAQVHQSDSPLLRSDVQRADSRTHSILGVKARGVVYTAHLEQLLRASGLTALEDGLVDATGTADSATNDGN